MVVNRVNVRHTFGARQVSTCPGAAILGDFTTAQPTRGEAFGVTGPCVIACGTRIRGASTVLHRSRQVFAWYKRQTNSFFQRATQFTRTDICNGFDTTQWKQRCHSVGWKPVVVAGDRLSTAGSPCLEYCRDSSIHSSMSRFLCRSGLT
jgi:hypothetical protein